MSRSGQIKMQSFDELVQRGRATAHDTDELHAPEAGFIEID
jgi:hypothetical protein